MMKRIIFFSILIGLAGLIGLIMTQYKTFRRDVEISIQEVTIRDPLKIEVDQNGWSKQASKSGSFCEFRNYHPDCG